MPDEPIVAVATTDEDSRSPNGSSFARTDVQRAEDDTLIADLIQKGVTNKREIWRKVNEKNSGRYTLSEQTVKKNMAAIEKQWAKVLTGRTLGEYKASQWWKADHLYTEAMDAWERSKREGQTMSGAVGATGEPSGSRSVTRTRRDGDPRWIEVMLKILERQAKIVGIDAPIKLEASVTGDSNNLEALRLAYRERIKAEVISNLPRKAENAIVEAEVVSPPN
jgi:hypothetical protein